MRPAIGIAASAFKIAGWVSGASEAGQRQQRRQAPPAAAFPQRPGLPLGHRVAFDRHSGRIANVAVGAVEVRPGEFDGGRIGLEIKRLQLVPQLVRGAASLLCKASAVAGTAGSLPV